MNSDVIKGKWKQLTGKIKERWGDLTDDDLQAADGHAEYLVGNHITLADVAAVAPNDDGDLAFVVQPLAAIGANHIAAVRIERCSGFMEIGWRRRQLGDVLVYAAAVIEVHANYFARLSGG